MKKRLLFLVGIVACIITNAQTYPWYVDRVTKTTAFLKPVFFDETINANEGLKLGTNGTKIDSLWNEGDTTFIRIDGVIRRIISKPGGHTSFIVNEDGDTLKVRCKDSNCDTIYIYMNDRIPVIGNNGTSGGTGTITGTESVFDGWDKNVSNDFDGNYNSLTNRPNIPDSVSAHESDPVYIASVAYGITETDTSNWNRKLEYDTIGVITSVNLTPGVNYINTNQSATVPKNITIQDNAYTNITEEVNIIGCEFNTTWYIKIYSSVAYSDLTIYYLKDDAGINTRSGSINDTTVLFVFGAGVGNSVDTNAFSTTNYYGAFYNKDTLFLTQLVGIVQGASPSVNVQISWHSTLGSVSATNLNTVAFTVTSTTTGTIDNSFDNSIVPPGVWIWATTPTITKKPTMALFNLIGYRK